MKSIKKLFYKAKPAHPTGSEKLYTLLILFNLILGINFFANGQQSVQIRTYDQQLQPLKNIEVSINNKSYISTGANGETFIELADHELPIKTIKIKNDQLEPDSWNHSKGVLQIVVRRKNYQVAHVVVKDSDKKLIPNLAVTFKGKKNITATTNAEGKMEFLLPLDEKISTADQFVINGFDVSGLQLSDRENVLTIHPIKVVPPESAASPAATAQQKPVVVEQDYFKDFDITKLDSIQSLTVFYAVFKNYQIKDLDEDVRKRVDKKFNDLVSQLQDSVQRNQGAPIGRISDSSFVRDDVKNLLNQAAQESTTLQTQRSEFDEKIRIINEKLEEGVTNLDPDTRQSVLSDLIALEKLLTENEGRFYKNINDYREIINSLKEKYFDFQNLENRLSESEAKRLEDQRIFRQRLIAISSVVIAFGVLIVLLISFSARLRKQKKELQLANAEVKRMNENLENIVLERTKLLAEAHRELDTFLYRASHDLRSPVCSIIGLCNIALHLSDGETKELVKKVASTTEGMDKLLKKLSIISETNQPTNYSSITLLDIVEDVQYKLTNTIKKTGIEFHADCPTDLTFYSYPNLIEVVITNLIENALFYSVMRDPVNARVEFKATIKDDQLEFSVYDNGIGVDSTIQPRLFDMFFKGHADSKGNGLGLYIVQKSVQTLEGSISVESEPGRYTKFIVNLPLTITPVEKNREVALV